MLKTIALTLILALSPAYRECGSEDVAKFVRGADGVARGIRTGISTVRAFREAGKISPEWALARARQALVVNTLNREVVALALAQPVAEDGSATLDAEARVKLKDQIEQLLASARRLTEEGALGLEGDAKLVFDLTVVTAEGAVGDMLADLDTPGVVVKVSRDARRKLERARGVTAENEARLREAIERLSAPPVSARQLCAVELYAAKGGA